MSLFKRSPRRSIAAVATVGALAAAFVVVPALAAPALASNSSTAASLFADLNTKRTSSDVNVAAVAPSGWANIAAAGLAKLYAGSKHPCAPNGSYPPPSSPVVADTNTVICTSVATGSNEASRLLAKMESIAGDSAVLNAGLGFYNVAGVGVYTKGSKAYAAIDMLGYTTLPYGYLAFSTPTIGGTAQVGHTLTVHYAAAVPDNGSTTGISYDIQWMATGVGEVGTGSTYQVGAGAVGHTITAYVAATKSGFVQHAITSKPTKAVKKGTFAVSYAVNGSKKVIPFIFGSVVPDLPDVTPSVTPTYQWYRGSHVLSGETTEGHSVVQADIHHQLIVKASYAQTGYTTLVLTFKTASSFPGLTFESSAPTIAGYGAVPEVGNTLTSSITGWTPDASFTESWKVNGVVKGTGTSFLLKSSYIGKKITVTYRGSYPLYVTTSRTSAATPKVVS